jgi:hypothetical protein
VKNTVKHCGCKWNNGRNLSCYTIARSDFGLKSIEQNALVAKVNLSKSYVSELMKISNLEQDINDEALSSNYRTHSRLLQLAKIANHEARMKKFDEFKK